MILITGATGTIGSELVKALLPAQADHLRVLTRDPDAVFPEGTEKVVADLGDGDLAPVLDGVRTVFSLTEGLNIAAHGRRLIDAAQQAGAERIVKLSVRNVAHGATDPISSLHRADEDAIRGSGIGWTFLRPTGFMSNALNWVGMITGDQVVYAPFAAGRGAFVDPADIAAVAAACLTQDGHDHRIYELTGPDPLSPADQVAILSKVLGRDLRYAEADPTGWVAQMVSYGMPVEHANAIGEQFRSTLEPWSVEPTSDVTTVTNRPARSFTDWAEAHRNELLTPASR
ncbi:MULTISPECIES: NAD(P)H-binding protein [Streptomyces]|uniref:NmrA family NAD(P)-binding protein n=1 Tax=Streptomyces TaxID=1883 RepID=UPI001CCC4E16|nr:MULTISPECIES: NAD(P)H-binding protein [Streptomyces]MBZ6138245.1 NAD(P)H-binding protein [Streptomyces olivaceus]MBZ6167964.1 NAD(P)H-binding protein [Streptomyces olivaceus]MBZ6173202.1 NAD(P)H-binding protein [Streptomyces olivaceus]MBZ6183570.1 NAD(P)H-binding protein [Streptomyces olivaceus]MCM8550661.1 NAD(P)H-binding protein [Streptomyces sp. STCH 565 A]